MSVLSINCKKLDERAILPTKGSEWAAGNDLYALLPDGDAIILPGETVKISTGIAIELPAFTFGGIFARSGLATKRGLRPSNCVGVVDPDFRGEVIVALHNDSDAIQTVTNGERIAQLVIIPYVDYTTMQVAELSETKRGECGFGSTGD